MRTAFYRQNFSVPYVPTLSPGFDSSPRTLPSDGWPTSAEDCGRWGEFALFALLPQRSNGRLAYFVFAIRYGYPWSVSWTSNMSQWRTALQRTKEAMAPQCNGDGWCPPLLVNAWCATSLQPDICS